MSNKWLPAALLMTAATLVHAAPVDTGKSTIGFIMKQMSVPTNGSFKKFSGNVTLNPAKAEAGKVDITIDTTSVSLPTAEANDDVKKAEWFNTAKFPTARFVSTHIKGLGNNSYQVDGTLTLKGTTKPVSTKFTIKPDGNLLVADGVLPISRLAFKVGDGDWADTSVVADAVQVKFHVAFPASK